MNIDKNELQQLMNLAFKAIKSIRSEPDYQQSEVLKEYVLHYERFINTFHSNDLEKLELMFRRLLSLSRAFLETDSDWKKPCLNSMYDFESYGRTLFRY